MAVPVTDYSAAGIATRKAAIICAIKKNFPDTKLTPDDLFKMVLKSF